MTPRPKGSQNRRGYGQMKGPEPTPATDRQIFCFCDRPWPTGGDGRCLKCGKKVRDDN